MGLASWALFFCSPLSRPCSPFNIYIYIYILYHFYCLDPSSFWFCSLPLSFLYLYWIASHQHIRWPLYVSICFYCWIVTASVFWAMLCEYITLPQFSQYDVEIMKVEKKKVFSFDHFITCTIQLHIAIFSKFRNHWHKMCRSFLRRWHTM